MDLPGFEARYINACKRHGVLPNSSLLSCFPQAHNDKGFRKEKHPVVVLLNQLKEEDMFPLLDVFCECDSSVIHAVNLLCQSPCDFNQHLLLSLLSLISPKLRVVDLSGLSLEENVLSYIFNHGLGCHTLNLRCTVIHKLNMVGEFLKLQTLNLDFCTSITLLDKDCFSFMPNLMHLSMRETRIFDLSTTIGALSKLPSLWELRFQSCLCCNGTGPCPISEKQNIKQSVCSSNESPPANKGGARFEAYHADETCANPLSTKDSLLVEGFHQRTDDSFSDVSYVSSSLKGLSLLNMSMNVVPYSSGPGKLQKKIEDSDDIIPSSQANLKQDGFKLTKYDSHHPSPICFEKHYREYMIASLPYLKVLDNIFITEMESNVAATIFLKFYEYLPYKRKQKESVVSILQKRERGAGGICYPRLRKEPYSIGKGQYFFPRSLSTAKLGSATWPLMQSLSSSSHIHKGHKKLRARQFEYHPSDSRLLAFGTMDGEINVINHENGKTVGFVPYIGTMNSILGLCWLKKYPSKLLAGSDNGCMKLFDINCMLPKVDDVNCTTRVVSFVDFEQLTSVHANATDDHFLASGYSKDVALYDINTGSRLQLFKDMHREPINVAKFANHSPFTFATSSFDHDVKMWDLRQKPVRPCFTASSSRGNVMVCFSPDDRYLLVSAVDNEVKQLSTADGRLQMDFEIASSGNAHNYTRSYYINEGDYIISGSCDEQVIRICCAQTGRRLRDVYLEDPESRNPLFVQSLRGDPFRPFHFSVLTMSKSPSSKWEIMKINLLSSRHGAKDYKGGLLTRSVSNLVSQIV